MHIGKNIYLIGEVHASPGPAGPDSCYQHGDSKYFGHIWYKPISHHQAAAALLILINNNLNVKAMVG